MKNILDTFCILPWTHLCVRPDEKLKPCCRFQIDDTSKLDLDLDNVAASGKDAMNNAYWTQLRTDMLSGIKRDECRKCHLEETPGSQRRSMRQWVNDRLVEEDGVYTNKFYEVEFIEMSIDNICNLQCKMCDSKFSSKLQLRDKFLGQQIHKKLEPSFTKFDNLNLTKLKSVKILGGEPFMTPNFIKFIDYLISRSNVENIILDIVTNGTKIPNNEIIKKLNKFKRLDIHVSLDSYDKSNDYQRFGSSYIEVFKNAQRYEKLFTNSIIAFHTVISILNANTLANTLNFLVTNHNYHTTIDFVRDPKHLSLLYAPDDLLDEILKINLSNKVAYKTLSTFFRTAKYNKEIWQEFLTNIVILDKFYNTDLKDYNIFLYNYINKEKLNEL